MPGAASKSKSRSISQPLPHERGKGLGQSPARQGYCLSGRLWVERKGATFLAWGRVVLLERIRDHGSISAAARSMGMSYRHAWNLVNEMNRLSPVPLVERVTGGAGGGGTRLTPAGETTIQRFWSMVAEFQKWLAKQDTALWRTE